MHIDWITVTKVGKFVGQSEATSIFGALMIAREALAELGLAAETLSATHQEKFYAYTFQDQPTGAVVSVGKRLTEQGVKVVLSGSSAPLAVDGTAVLRQAMENNWKPTRLDVAHDFIDPEWTVMDIAEAWKDQHGEDANRRYRIEAGKRGDTFYIGSRKSTKYMRIYDKGAEQGLDRQHWLRCEIEFKGVAAVGLASKLLSDRSHAAYEMAVMLDLADSTLGAWLLNASTSDSVVRSSRPKTQTNREVWFKSQVIPAMKALYLDDREGYFRCLEDLLIISHPLDR